MTSRIQMVFLVLALLLPRPLLASPTVCIIPPGEAQNRIMLADIRLVNEAMRLQGISTTAMTRLRKTGWLSPKEQRKLQRSAERYVQTTARLVASHVLLSPERQRHLPQRLTPEHSMQQFREAKKHLDALNDFLECLKDPRATVRLPIQTPGQRIRKEVFSWKLRIQKTCRYISWVGRQHWVFQILWLLETLSLLDTTSLSCLWPDVCI